MKKITLVIGFCFLIYAGLYIYATYTQKADLECIVKAGDLADPFTYGEEFVIKNVYAPCGIDDPGETASSTLRTCVKSYYQSEEWKILRQKSNVAYDECRKRIKERWIY